MSNLNLRKRTRISYCEPEEPNLDEYVFCTYCEDFVYEYCAIHKPLLIIPDDKVPSKSPYPPCVPRSALTIPHVFLHLAPSIIPGAGIGVFSTLTLPQGVRFGPYRGRKIDEVKSMYSWQIHDGNNRRSHFVDAEDANKSNWMRFVNCSRHWNEQNLVAYQYRGQLYYRTIKIIPKFTELMVFYGGEFANILQINLKKYNSPVGYAQKLGAPIPQKKSLKQNETLNENQENIFVPPNVALTVSPIKTKAVNLSKLKKSTDRNNNKNITSKSKTKIKINIAAKEKQSKPSDKETIEEKGLPKHPIKTTQTTEKVSKSINSELIYKLQSLKNVKPHDDISIKKITENNKLICDICNYETIKKTNLISHLRLHNDFRGKIYACSYCKYITNNKNSLEIHVRIHTNERSYGCQICSKKFIQKNSFIIHTRIHTGEKPYECGVCKKKFNDKQNFKNHTRIHTGEKPYECGVCKKKFNDKQNFKNHTRIHTGEKPYECQICSKKFIQKNHFIIHTRIHTGEKPYECGVCKKKFNYKQYFKSHTRIHTGEKPYECQICLKKFNQTSNLKTHLKTHT